MDPTVYQRYLGFALTIIAIVLFVPGILLPMFNLNMEMAIGVSGTSFNSQLVDKELSIITTVQELWVQHRYLVAALIFVFSIVIPIAKTIAMSIVFFSKAAKARKRIASFVNAIGKWSMADVFVVAVFLAVLSTNHEESADTFELTFFGFNVDVGISTQTLSMVGEGFYYFTAYCLLSVLGAQLLMRSLKDKPVPS